MAVSAPCFGVISVGVGGFSEMIFAGMPGGSDGPVTSCACGLAEASVAVADVFLGMLGDFAAGSFAALVAPAGFGAMALSE